MKKVYSIWITMDTDDDEDSISKFSLKSETVFGKETVFPELDKMCGVIIRIRENDDVDESKNQLIAMLEDMLRNEDGTIKKGKLMQLFELVQEGYLKEEDAAKKAGMTVEVFKKEMQEAFASI